MTSYGFMDHECKKRSNHNMITMREVFFMLPCLMVCLVGCKPETVRDEVGKSPRDEAGKPPRDEKEREVEKGLKLAADWQSHFDLFYVKKTHFLSKLSQAIANEGDEERYKKYMRRFIDTAFGIPTDADESGARLQQLNSLCHVTEAVMGCADGHDDWKTYWEVAIRRVERIQSELQKIRTHFPEGDPPGDDLPVLGRGGWDNCLKLLKQEYGMASRDLSRFINNFLMANVLSKEEWTVIHDRLEKVLDRNIPVKQVLLDIWAERERKR